jgi:DNA-binding transcriptional ArsR family regulator
MTQKKYDRWDRERKAAIARRMANEAAREARLAALNARRVERDRLAALRPKKIYADAAAIRRLFDEGVEVSALASHFHLSEQTIQFHLKATR